MCKSDALHEDMGDNHIGTSDYTPLKADAFSISDDEKIELIKKDVENILNTLGMDLTDDSLKGTPNRVAKMFVKEIFGGLNPAKKPSSSTFDNKYKYNEMLVEKKHCGLFNLRTSLITYSWACTCGIYIKRKSSWFI